MVRGRCVLHIAAFAIAFLVLSTSAWGDIHITGAGYIVPNGATGASNAVLANILGLTPDFTFTSTGLQYSSYGNNSCATGPGDTCTGTATTDQTINSWLGSLGSSGPATFSGLTNTHLGGVANGSTVLTDNNNWGTIFRFDITGAAFSSGQAFSLAHDDGVTILVGGNFDANGNLTDPIHTVNVGVPLGVSPLPTAPTVTNFVYPGTDPLGAQNAEFIYGECCTLPAVLQTDLVPFTNVPEPTSILLLGTVLAGLAGLLRRRFSA